MGTGAVKTHDITRDHEIKATYYLLALNLLRVSKSFCLSFYLLANAGISL